MINNYKFLSYYKESIKNNDNELEKSQNKIAYTSNSINKIKSMFEKNKKNTVQSNNSNDPYDEESIAYDMFKNTMTKYDEIKKMIELENEAQQKNQKHKSDYTIIKSLKKVYYDLLMMYKGDIDAIFEDLLNDEAIDQDCEKPYIIHSHHHNDNESNLDYLINKQLYNSHPIGLVGSYSHTYPTQTVGSHTHTINTNYMGATNFHHYIDDHSDYIDITEFTFVENKHVLNYVIQLNYWQYASKHIKQKLILNDYIKNGYIEHKELHDVDFCVQYIQQYPTQEIICETHPEVMQTKEFQKYVKILKMKDEYEPY